MFDAVVILGPTASGKSALALNLAWKLKNCEIISLDSALIYQGMDIGTAKPTKEELASVPHHLIDIIDPKDKYSAADFREDCIKLISEIKVRGNLPIICGGTMLYYKALVEGISPMPQSTKEVREQVLKEAEVLGWPALHEKLKDIDPILYEKYAPNDKQRVARALEVFYMTGKAMSSYYDQKGDPCPYKLLEFAIIPKDRIILRENIKKRLDIMFSQGFIEEVRKLKERGDLNLNMPSMRCVGYRQVWEYLDGIYDKDTMMEQCVIATARLAKHQMTWLRGGLNRERVVLDYLDDKNLDIVLSHVLQ